jgi:2-octaprenyl-6-methoxyphenol hydroxylase
MTVSVRHEQYDVVIIGAGMVGLTLACMLDKSPSIQAAKILLLESNPVVTDKAHQPGFDARSTVLSYGTVLQLERLGLWKKLKQFASPITTIHVSDQGRFGQALISAEEEKVSALGHVLENQPFGQLLNQEVLVSERVEILSPVQVKHIRHEATQASLLCYAEGNEFSIKASLVVLAEGGRSGLPESLGISRQQKDYAQVGIIANLAFSEPHRNVAYERFTPSGPLAVLPLKNFEGLHRAALIWTQAVEDFQAVLQLNDEAFLEKLQKEFGHRLGTISKVGNRLTYPFLLKEASEQIRHNLVLLGNTAHSLHPVAGQGFNLAFRDSLCLAENIAESFRLGCSPGAYNRLEKYLQQVSQDQRYTISFSHYLTSLFSSELELLGMSRKFGLIGIDLLPSLKNILSRQAMGLGNPAAELERQ